MRCTVFAAILFRLTMAQRVIVVGGGAAGLMAAGQAAGLGAETTLLEKMNRPGRKLRITGKGRCNITNVAPVAEFVDRFGPNGSFLRQAFHRYFNADLVAFFTELGIRTVIERGGRVFPASDNAGDVVDELVSWARAQGAILETHTAVEQLLVRGGAAVGVRATRLPSRKGKRSAEDSAAGQPLELRADSVVVATGGASYPGTGSTGDGYRLAAEVGHNIVPIRPALVPLETARLVTLRQGCKA